MSSWTRTTSCGAGTSFWRICRSCGIARRGPNSRRPGAGWFEGRPGTRAAHPPSSSPKRSGKSYGSRLWMIIDGIADNRSGWCRKSAWWNRKGLERIVSIVVAAWSMWKQRLVDLNSSAQLVTLQVCLARAGWRFQGAVHEYMTGPEGSHRGQIDLPSVSLYQVHIHLRRFQCKDPSRPGSIPAESVFLLYQIGLYQ